MDKNRYDYLIETYLNGQSTREEERELLDEALKTINHIKVNLKI